MDPKRFDALARWMGSSSSRRRGLLSALSLGAALVSRQRPLAAQDACAGRQCPAGTICIDGLCIPVAFDACLTGNEPCQADADCVLSVGEICCFGTCVNPVCDGANCGRCERRCGADERCAAGVCVAPGACPWGTFVCGSTCCGPLERCNGSICEGPPELDVIGVSLGCAQEEELDQGGNASYECSLRRIYGTDKTLECMVEVPREVVLNIAGRVLKALKAPGLADRIENIDTPLVLIDLREAETDLDRVVEAIGIVLPTDCIVGLAELFSGGQYSALQLCLQDELCTDLLVEELAVDVGLRCPRGQDRCGITCNDLGRDTFHCGACWNVCGLLQVCCDGVCGCDGSAIVPGWCDDADVIC